MPTSESVTRHADALEALLPTGMIWRRRKNADGSDGVRRKVIRGLATEAAQVTDRAAALLLESDPSTATETIADWELYAGIPTDESIPLADRRTAVVSKLTATRGSSVQFFIDLVLPFGFVITIEEFEVAHAGPNAGSGDLWANGYRAKVGDRVYGRDWQFVFWVHLVSSTGAWPDSKLEELILEAKPAHTLVGFVY